MRRLLLSCTFCLACSSGSPAESTAPAQGATETASAVKPIPDAFHTVTPILVLEDVRAGIDWYGKAFGAERTLALEMPDGTIAHAEIKIGDSLIMLVGEDAEAGAQAPIKLGGTNGAIQLWVEDVDAVSKAALDAGAKADMPVADMFWGDRFTELTDPFGHSWSVSTHKEDVEPTVLEERAKAFGEAMTANKEPPKVELQANAKSWKPEGYHQVTPVFWVDGGAEALAFYESAFGAKVTEKVLMPDQKTLMHGELQIGDTTVMLASVSPESKHKTAKGLGGASVRYYVFIEDVDAAYKQAVEAGATPTVPVADMPWGDRWGVVVDPHGTAWGLATHIEDVTPEEVQQRIKAMMEEQAAAESG
jgi:PhnB protein